jgi:hypothetical protein
LQALEKHSIGLVIYVGTMFFCIGNFFPNFNLKNIILTYTKNFSWEIGPNSLDFGGKFNW